MQKTIFIIILLGFVSCTPTVPVWPQQFTQTFNESFFLDDSIQNTTGQYIYDSPSQSYRINRANGQYEKFCQSSLINGSQIETPCDHIVVKGDRYLYYPKLNQCCYCCDAAHGCGILKRNWLEGAKFLGYEAQGDLVLEKWQKDGGQPNYYFNTANKQQLMVEIDQVPYDKLFFNIYSFKLSVDQSQLQKPSICSQTNLCVGDGKSLCSLFRNQNDVVEVI